MRKLVSILLSVLLLAALVIPAAAEETTEEPPVAFALTASAETVEVGEEVTLTITVAQEIECWVYGVALNSESFSEGFELVEVKSEGAGMKFHAPMPGDDAGVMGAGLDFVIGEDDATTVQDPLSSAMVKISGTAGTVTLKAKKAGTYTITAASKIFVENSVEYSVTPVTIEVEEASGGSVIIGDINGDSKINGRDGILLAQYLADWDVTINLDAADVNGDGKVNGRDGILLAQYLADWDVTLG